MLPPTAVTAFCSLVGPSPRSMSLALRGWSHTVSTQRGRSSDQLSPELYLPRSCEIRTVRLQRLPFPDLFNLWLRYQRQRQLRGNVPSRGRWSQPRLCILG